MGNAVVDWIFRRPKFCCCLPVRAAAIVISMFTLLVSAFIALVSWFEVATYKDMWGPLKDAYIGAGVIYTLLFLASTMGFVGAIVRKQLFITIFSYALYIDILINAGLAGYVLWMVNHAKQVDLEKLCTQGFNNAGTSAQCSEVLKITDAVVFVVAFTILAVELYWAIVITRYVHQIKSEKTFVRQSRIMNRQGRESAALSLLPPKEGKDQPFSMDDDPYSASATNAQQAYDPYRPYESESAYRDPFLPSIPEREIDLGRRASAAEEGYGGGEWRYSSVVTEEKGAGRRGENVTDSTLVDGPLPLLDGPLPSHHELEEGERTPTPYDAPALPLPQPPSTPPFINRQLQSGHLRGGSSSPSNASVGLPAYSFVERRSGSGSPPF